MIIWLASYPRSGNTWIRTILKDSFGLKSYSIYEEKELWGIFGTEDFVWDLDKYKEFKESSEIYFVKTHDVILDGSPAIYVQRNGIDAIYSFSRMKAVSFIDACMGQCYRFPSWSTHYKGWSPQIRPDVLYLKYENMLSDIDNTILMMEHFIGQKSNGYVDNFNQYKKISPDVIGNRGSSYIDKVTEKDLSVFRMVHGDILRETGY